MWQELIKNINNLIIIYQSLFSLNEDKRRAVLAIDMEKLSQIVESEQKLTQQIVALEQERQNILLELSKEKQLVKSDLRAIDLQQLCPVELQGALQKVNLALSQIVEKTTRLNENNMMLLQGALAAVNVNLNNLTDTQAQPDYGKDGSQAFSQQKREFDFKA